MIRKGGDKMSTEQIEKLTRHITDNYMTTLVGRKLAEGLDPEKYAEFYMIAYGRIMKQVAESAYIMPATENIMASAAENKEPMGPLR